MSEILTTISNIKIPHPTEGVIRTAQLDDTVSPENSVQLAVNMNFDRVGATQTRPGVEEFADEIDGPVVNFGTLNNSGVGEGYSNLRKLPTTNEIGDPISFVSLVRIDDTHALSFWTGTDSDGFAQVIEVDLETGVATLEGTPLEFDTTNGEWNACHRIDGTHYINFWTGASGDGFAQVFLVNTTTWAVTALGTPLEFDTAEATYNAVTQIDSNHFMNCYRGTGSDGIASIFEVNLGTWAVTEVGSGLTFDSGSVTAISIVSVGDGEHVLVFWASTSVGYAQVLEVNTGTWNITALDSPLNFEAENSENKCFALGDGEHFVNTWVGNSSDGFTQVFNVDPSTFALTAVGTPLNFESTSTVGISSVSFEDGQHFIAFWGDPSYTGYARVFEVNLTTYAITTLSLEVEFAEVANPTAAVRMNDYNVLALWGDTLSVPGSFVGSIFNTFGDLEYTNYLYAQDGNYDVYNNDGSGWTLRRTGLNTEGKARFAQYLNYIWMVNGGDTFGDPVATSNGGTFGTDLVPALFPPGDFISAGFEGRVWVADAGYDVIYYTDIVQFVPPDTYTLTFDPDVNFIKSLSPQDGQRITGLMRVPRALLVFKQDSIYRIYGATSIDAYPAYNVGTYSQESIVTTKTGIFFHHSSGFYQFDYGSQPIEISRRVIDFVKAIPRAYYDNVTGVYDGFDAIEWSVGQVTVEGVVFSNCVMRYTISTQVWTIYDYVGNAITAMISYDNGTDLVHLMGTSLGKVGSMDVGTTDFGVPFYYEYIDRWRSYTDMYYLVKSISGMSVHSENAAGANVMFQVQKSGPNVWETLMTVNEKNNSIFANVESKDFDVARLRIAGTTSGVPVVIHGIEILDLTVKGLNEN